MALINIFTNHIVNKKSLKDYVEIRKILNERGEFNDESLLKAEENLQRLKQEDKKTYNLMYENNRSPKKVYEEYSRSLEHHYNDA